MAEDNRKTILIGIDIGGTFTDIVLFDQRDGTLSTSKILSTPRDPAQAVLEGLKNILKGHHGGKQLNPPMTLTHGSTVATNALLERNGARTALVTTAGFRDVLEIGRQSRLDLYDLSARKPEPLVPEPLRFEVAERVDHQGKVLKALDQKQVQDLVAEIEKSTIESVAISLLFSFLNPNHEQQIAKALDGLGVHLSLSSVILPEFREYERTSTTVVNAYVSPILAEYLTTLEESLEVQFDVEGMRIMQSNGGIISLSEARQAGVRCILSGPAGGVVGASFIGQSMISPGAANRGRLQPDSPLKLVTFDMGGTSTDVSLVDRYPAVSTEGSIAGFPVGIPMLDIHTIGAGGGSIARVDRGGALRVGPESAGAAPGPACYALGNPEHDVPTVTDANVVLGRLPVDQFLGGEMKLDRNRAIHVIAKLGAELGMTAIQAALGVVQVVNAHMERALRLVTIERGYDPQAFTLVSFGGAGGLHAINLARRLSISQVIVPPVASTLSAFGMLVTDVLRDYSQTIMRPGSISNSELLVYFQPLDEQGYQDLVREGFSPDMIHLERSLDIRYSGQSYELNVPYRDDLLEAFHEMHQSTYGYALPDVEVELVNIRLRAVGSINPPVIPALPEGDSDPGKAFLGKELVFTVDQEQEIPLYQGETLLPGNCIDGPALVVRKDTTVYLPGESFARVDRFLNLVISVEGSGLQPGG